MPKIEPTKKFYNFLYKDKMPLISKIAYSRIHGFQMDVLKPGPGRG
jgi:hypothetical protein